MREGAMARTVLVDYFTVLKGIL